MLASVDIMRQTDRKVMLGKYFAPIKMWEHVNLSGYSA